MIVEKMIIRWDSNARGWKVTAHFLTHGRYRTSRGFFLLAPAVSRMWKARKRYTQSAHGLGYKKSTSNKSLINHAIFAVAHTYAIPLDDFGSTVIEVFR